MNSTHPHTRVIGADCFGGIEAIQRQNCEIMQTEKGGTSAHCLRTTARPQTRGGLYENQKPRGGPVL
jgi:hypothetical protein